MEGKERFYVCEGENRKGPFDREELSRLHESGGIGAGTILVAADGTYGSTVGQLLGAGSKVAVDSAAGLPPVATKDAGVARFLGVAGTAGVRTETVAGRAPRGLHIDFFQRIGENRRNSVLLIGFFVVLLGVLGLALGLFLGAPLLGAFGAMFAAAIMTLFAYNQGGQAILSLSGAKKIIKADNPHLFNTVEGLSLAAGLPMPKIYLINSAAPNAFATGRDPAHAAVAVTSGLLEKLDRLELEGVIAHEMAHVGNQDIRIALLITALVGSVVLLAEGARNLFRFGFNLDNDDRGSSAAQLIGMVISLILALISPLLALLLQAAISRQREFLADAEGARLTRYPEGLASALEKISRDTTPLFTANKATAHLFVINPLLDHGGKINALFNTHPPAAERIRRLRAM